MKALPDLVQQESLAGRELVISETHGALSTNLRLIEQQAREIRDVALASTTRRLSVTAAGDAGARPARARQLQQRA